MFKRKSPKEVSEMIRDGIDFRLIDVREMFEHAIASVEKAELMPLSEFQEWFPTLESDQKIVVMCHHGVRSANVCMFLISNGFSDVTNLEGGIDSWSIDVDLNIPRY